MSRIGKEQIKRLKGLLGDSCKGFTFTNAVMATTKGERFNLGIGINDKELHLYYNGTNYIYKIIPVDEIKYLSHWRDEVVFNLNFMHGMDLIQLCFLNSENPGVVLAKIIPELITLSTDLAQAIDQEMTLTIKYNGKTRRVIPLSLNDQRLSVHCLESEKIKTFLIEKITWISEFGEAV